MRRKKLTCESCREASIAIKRVEPDCEHCRPEIHENNIEAWNVANMIGIGSNESVQGIFKVCRMMGVSDENEIFFKLRELHSAIRSFGD